MLINEKENTRLKKLVANMALEVERNIGSNQLIEVLERVVVERGWPPKYIRSDNGPEFLPEPSRNG